MLAHCPSGAARWSDDGHDGPACRRDGGSDKPTCQRLAQTILNLRRMCNLYLPQVFSVKIKKTHGLKGQILLKQMGEESEDIVIYILKGNHAATLFNVMVSRNEDGLEGEA